MKDPVRQSYRWSAHTAGAASVKPKDYEPAGVIEANSPYSAWSALLGTESPLAVGDLLESPEGELRIYKYVGFEEARWVLPEVKTGVEGFPVAAGAPEASATA